MKTGADLPSATIPRYRCVLPFPLPLLISYKSGSGFKQLLMQSGYTDLLCLVKDEE